MNLSTRKKKKCAHYNRVNMVRGRPWIDKQNSWQCYKIALADSINADKSGCQDVVLFLAVNYLLLLVIATVEEILCKV